MVIWSNSKIVKMCDRIPLDASLPQNGRAAREHKCLPLILILGYTTGFSIWSIQVCVYLSVYMCSVSMSVHVCCVCLYVCVCVVTVVVCMHVYQYILYI